jgi:hypothetical protein
MSCRALNAHYIGNRVQSGTDVSDTMVVRVLAEMQVIWLQAQRQTTGQPQDHTEELEGYMCLVEYQRECSS